MKKGRKKEVPLKNYFYSLLVLVGTILLVLYIFSWYTVKKEERLMNSYLISTKTIESKIENLNDLEQTLKEAPLSYFVLVSFTGNEDAYKIEKSLKRAIDKYKLNDLFYYIDSTLYKDDLDYINKLNKIFNTKDIKNIPLIIYVEEGKSKVVLNNVTSDSFINMLENNDYKIVK